MDIQAKIADAEQKFEEFSKDREVHLKAADDCATEMNRLQGEYRVLQDLQAQDKKAKKVSTIDVKPEVIK